jgi:hypothetical protein
MKILLAVQYILQKDTWHLAAREIRARGLSGCVEGSWTD